MDILSMKNYIKSNIKFLNQKFEFIEFSIDNNIESIGNNLLEFSIYMIRFGIDFFDKGKNYAKKYDSFHEQLKDIPKQIEKLIDEYDPIKQRILIFSNLEKLKLQQQELNNWKTVNVVFKDSKGQETNLTVETKITFKELFDRYMNKAYGFENSDISFGAEHIIIKRDDNTKIKDFYYQYIGKPVLPIIRVLNLKK